jgi:hypothetical protein
VIYPIPTRGFTAAVSVFGGTPPPKPFECKIWLNTIGAHFCDRWADPTGREPRLSRALFSFVSVDIIEMSPSFRSQIVHLSSSFSVIQGKQKPCLLCGRQGLEKFYGSSLTCPPPVYPNSFRGIAHDTTWIGQGQTYNPGLTGYDVSLARPTLSAKSPLICSCRFSSNVKTSKRGARLRQIIFRNNVRMIRPSLALTRPRLFPSWRPKASSSSGGRIRPPS